MTSVHSTPAPTRAVRAAASTVTSFIRWVAITTAPGAVPTTWWPVVLTRTGRRCPAAKVTAAWTSAALSAATITAGTSSWLRLKTARSSSYPASPGSSTGPATAAARAAASSDDTDGSDESLKVIDVHPVARANIPDQGYPERSLNISACSLHSHLLTWPSTSIKTETT